jgi:hypothetical protein
MLDTLPTDLQNIVMDFARPRTTIELVLMLKEIYDHGFSQVYDHGFSQDCFEHCMKTFKWEGIQIGYELVTWVPQGKVERKRLHQAYKFFDWLKET